MILYANGCSHTAAAEAVVREAFAVDDGKAGINRRPHPLNLAASWCTKLAEKLNAELVCDAESASSNDRILRTTQSWLENNADKLSQTFVVIQWTTWEREEWLHNGVWYQVNASGADWVPPELRQRYKEYVINHDYRAKTQEWHTKIWDLHCQLTNSNIPHLFYNGWSTFSDIQNRHPFGTNYLGPYNRDLSYNSVLINNNFEWVSPNHYHFGANGHCFWAEYLLQYINDNNLIATDEIRTD
jgi:hypothetical protein